MDTKQTTTTTKTTMSFQQMCLHKEKQDIIAN